MKTVVRIIRRKLKPRGKRTVYSYAVQWVHHGNTRTESYGTNKELAERMMNRKKDELESGLYKEVKPITFDNFVEEHLDLLPNVQGKSNGTYAETERVLRFFRNICQPVNLADVDFRMLEQFKKARAVKLSPATLNKDLRTFQAALSLAVKRGYLKENPFKGNRQALYVISPISKYRSRTFPDKCNN